MFSFMNLLAERERARVRARERLFDETRRRLRDALHDLVPGGVFWVFGSLARRGRFNAASDIDLAFTELPHGTTQFGLAAALEERMGRPVDLIDLAQSRLRHKIESEGERWIA